MKLSDFIVLTKEEKKFTVLHRSILVAKRNNSTHFFFLFQMDQFYVETCCRIETKDVEEYKIFQHLKLLEPYLETIPIGDLLS